LHSVQLYKSSWDKHQFENTSLLINQRTLFDLEADGIEQILKIHEQPEAALKAGRRISDLLVVLTRGAYKRLASSNK
jgi:hypothetical protein